MEEKKNILFVIPSINSGGVEINLLELARQNHLENFFNMFVLTSDCGLLKNRLINCGVKVITLNVKTKNPLKIFLNIKKIKKIILQNEIDLVSAESRAPAWSCYFACKQLQIPFSTTVHGVYNNSSGIFGFFKRKYNSIMVRGDAIVCVSEYVKNYLLTNFKSYLKETNQKLAVIPRGIDLNIFGIEKITQNRVLIMQKELNLPEDKFVLTFPARFTRIKGQDYFLKVLKELYKIRSDFFCVMIGDIKKHPSYVKQIQKKIEKYGLNGLVKLHDNINDMPTLYFMSNIVVSCTKKAESFGRISVESQAMKRIFIGINMGATAEIITNKQNGFLVPHDSEKFFCYVLNQIMDFSESEKNKITENGYINSRQYSMKNMFEKTFNFYENIINNK